MYGSNECSPAMHDMAVYFSEVKSLSNSHSLRLKKASPLPHDCFCWPFTRANKKTVIQEKALDFYCWWSSQCYCIKKSHLGQKQWLEIISEYPVKKKYIKLSPSHYVLVGGL